jgi:hypothetical protein
VVKNYNYSIVHITNNPIVESLIRTPRAGKRLGVIYNAWDMVAVL